VPGIPAQLTKNASVFGPEMRPKRLRALDAMIALAGGIGARPVSAEDKKAVAPVVPIIRVSCSSPSAIHDRDPGAETDWLSR
jgi:hypothetical protein